jgi:malonyl-CoA/methylmalonyl-CoA synthetase
VDHAPDAAGGRGSDRGERRQRIRELNPVTDPAELQLIARARGFADRRALIGPEGSCSYAELLDSSGRVAAALLDGRSDLDEARVAFLVPPGLDHVAVQWGIWRAGGIAVPLALSHPRAELEYVVRDSDPEWLVCHPELEDRLRPIATELGLRYLGTDEISPRDAVELPELEPERAAMIVYTSGTTGKPKGVLSTHANIAAQVTSLVDAWGWRPDDHILGVLPLHHVHGIVNVLCCALWSGATCELAPSFDAEVAWQRLASGEITLFMAVPTIYFRLIAAWDASPEERRQRWSEGASGLRLMVSGSAALPQTTLERWREITGRVLLERYGMTEFGMALSNPLVGERRAGSVGKPLPGVEARLVDETGRPVAEGEPGEIQVRGPGVFREYWRRPEATHGAFRDGWFATGDLAVIEEGSYRILGRSSVDILKSGGSKISALEIEETLREHPLIDDCAVVGVADPEWGQRVAVAVVLAEGAALGLDELREWGRERLAPSKLPTLLRAVDDLPRSAMGKVFKPAVVEIFE